MLAFTIFLAIVALVWLGLLLSPWHRATFRDRIDATRPAPPADALPPLVMIVPARNEEAMLPDTVPAMCAIDYPGLTVILVDDQSDDASPVILRELTERYPQLKVLRADDRPEGWVGKSWAIDQAVRHVQTHHPHIQWFLFGDADTHYHRDSARLAMHHALAGAYDLLSLMPQVTFGRFSERLGVTGLLGILAVVYPTGLVNRPSFPDMMAAGGFILVRRQPYEAAGGHAAVRGHIVEDMNLARTLKRAGHATHFAYTRDLAWSRMYDGFGDMWEGLVKNAYPGMDCQPRKLFGGLLIALTIAILNPVYLAIAALLAAADPSPLAWTALGLAAASNLLHAAFHARVTRHLRLPFYHAFLGPLSAALYQAFAIASALAWHYRGGNTWKGRRYKSPATDPAAPPTPLRQK